MKSLLESIKEILNIHSETYETILPLPTAVLIDDKISDDCIKNWVCVDDTYITEDDGYDK